MIEFDRILDKIGHLGRYQMVLILMLYWLGVPTGLHNISSVFYAADVPFRCNVPPLDNSTAYPNLTETDILNYTAGGEYDTCQRYGYNLSSCEPPSLACVNMSAAPIDCDMGYQFDTSTFTSTVKSEWNLVCDRNILDTVATSIFFAGMWTGAIVFGNLADYIGRRNTMLVTCIGCLISGVATAFTPWFELFVVLRFFSAAFSHGAYLNMFVYVIEISGKKRTSTGVHAHTAFAVGYTLNSLVSYFLRDWRAFYLVISLSPIPFFIIYFILPDSPRWHFSNGRDEKGRKLTEIFAKHNRKILTEKDWEEAEVAQTDPELMNKTYTSFDLFKTKRMRLITLNNMFSWLVISMVYYGLSLNAGSLAGDIFVNNAINGAMELIGYFFVQFTMDRWGRRVLLVLCMVLQGVACLVSTAFTELANGNQALITTGVVFAFVGKVGVSGSFAVIYNYTAELYPTVVRGNALGIGSMAARIGSIASPYIIFLQDYVSWLPTTVFGSLSVIAGILGIFFPETMNKTMPQTIPEAELFYQGKYVEEKTTIEGKDNPACDQQTQF
ncbi:organic cation transporter protein-like [Clavelina lepadiformis]|uniref:Major facilitator superfamily (MFS) profile domain-containing protein n=1 Tax=Clavelina lepadiformis TaxID=159417 RepID=A0ABP0G001_CLALP